MSYYEDEIYHSGYLDGYYDSMELYHSDDSEMTEEERKARHRRRRRNIALGVGAGAALGVGGYAVGRALRKRRAPRLTGGSSGPTGPIHRGPRLTGPTLKRVRVPDYDVETPNGWDFKRNKPTYASDKENDEIYKNHEYLKKYMEWDHDKKKVRWNYPHIKDYL